MSGKKVQVDTGRDLTIRILQDVDNFKEHSKSGGFSVSSKPNFTDPTGSISASVGRIDSKWKSVTKQAGIYAGDEGYDIHTGNATTLEGALIKSSAPKEKNKLITKSLAMKDIHNEAEYTYSNNGIGYNYYGSKKKLEEMKTNDKKGYDKIYNNIGLVPNLGIGSKGNASSTTQSAISDGILTVDGKAIDTKTINTNTENTLHQLDKIFDKKKIEERQELDRLFSKNAFEQLHNWQPTTKDGKVAKSIAHGIIGELSARMAGNTPGSGFKAAMTNEMLIGEIKKVAKHDPALAQWISVAIGGVVNGVSGKSIAVGATEAQYATRFNHLHEFSEDWSLEDATTGMHQGILTKLEKTKPILSISDPTSEKNIISLAADASSLPAASFLLKQSVWGNGEFQYYDNDSIVSKVFKDSYHFKVQIAEMRVRIPPGNSMQVSGCIDYNEALYGVRPTKDQNLAFGLVKTTFILKHNLDGSMSYNGVIGDAYNFELKKFSTEDTIYKAALKVISNIAAVDQIYGIIQPFGWQAKVSGSI